MFVGYVGKLFLFKLFCLVRTFRRRVTHQHHDDSSIYGSVRFTGGFTGDFTGHLVGDFLVGVFSGILHVGADVGLGLMQVMLLYAIDPFGQGVHIMLPESGATVLPEQGMHLVERSN